MQQGSSRRDGTLLTQAPIKLIPELAHDFGSEQGRRCGLHVLGSPTLDFVH
jgi:hypothetical protein